MGVLGVTEVTSKGDSFGFVLSEPKLLTAERVEEATRYFLVTVDSAQDIGAVYELLPKRGDAHPNRADCYVLDVSCKVTDDVHVYQATVNYKWVNPYPSDPDLPWLTRGTVSFSSDASITRALAFAYASLGTSTNPAETTAEEIRALPFLSGDGINETVPIVNEPLKQPFYNPIQEPVRGLTLRISGNVAGGGGLIANTVHNYEVIEDVLACAQTVYGDPTVQPEARLPINIGGYLVEAFCGYVSDTSCEALYYKSAIENETYAYYKVDITIAVNPQTWVTKALNLSYDTLVDGKRTAITAKDGLSGVRRAISSPMEINPASGAPRFINNSSGEENTPANPAYLLFFVTKPMNNWNAITSIMDQMNIPTGGVTIGMPGRPSGPDPIDPIL